MATRSSAAQDDIDLVTVFGAIRRKLPMLLVISAIVGALAFGVMSLIAPRFTSEAQLAIVSKTTNPFPENSGNQQQPDNSAPRLDREAINTHVQAIGAPSLLLKVAEQLELNANPEFNSAAGAVDTLDRVMRLIGLAGPRPGETVDDRVLKAVKDRLQISAARESRYISITFSSVDRNLAASFANTLAESYRNGLVDVPVRETNTVLEALKPKIEQLNREVVDAESAVEQFRARTGRLLSGPQLVPLSSQRLSALSEELSRAEGERSQAEARWRTANDLSRTGSGEVLPEVQQSAVVQGLIGQRVRLERQVNEASAALLPAHPRMRQLNADLTGLKRSINAEVRKVVQSLEKSFRSASLRVDQIARQMAQLRTEAVDNSGDDGQLRLLESQAKSKRAELERLQRQLEDNKTLVVTKNVPVEAVLASQARPTGVPTFPKKGPIAALAAAATFLFGLAITAAGAIISPETGAPKPAGPVRGGKASRKVTEPEFEDDYDDEPQVEVRRPGAAAAVAAGGAAVAASVLPRGRAGAPKPAAAAPARVRLDTAAAAPADEDQIPTGLANIATHLESRAEDGVGYRTMVVGETDRITAHDEAIDLVQALAATGKRVVLVDWATDGRGLGADLGLNGEPGIVELLEGGVGFDDVISSLMDGPVHLIPCGGAIDTDVALDGDGINLILDALDEAYDHIVVTGGHTDAKNLFEAIQGRFDAGVSICDERRKTSLIEESENSFLGFEVTDIDVIRYERSENSATSTQRRELGTEEPA
ncbi:MAG: exopolysaccharide transport family protein [Pseudomonadota bacterium]